MKSIDKFLKEALENQGFTGDVLQFKKDYILYTNGDYDMFCDVGKDDAWEELQKYLGNSRGDIVIPKGSIIQLSFLYKTGQGFLRGFALYTKKVNFMILVMNADQEKEVMGIANEITEIDLKAFIKKYNAISISKEKLKL